MCRMDYISHVEDLTVEEKFLTEKMWNVLVQSYRGTHLTTLGSLKRFVFVVEGLTVEQDGVSRQSSSEALSTEVLKDLKMLFSEFKPLYLNRLAKGRARRDCLGLEDPNLTFRPVLSPRTNEILSNRS